MAEIVDFMKYQRQNQRWGLNSLRLQRCDLYDLILQFVKRSREWRRHPDDRELALWLEEVALAVVQRCSNPQLIDEAKKILATGSGLHPATKLSP